MARTKAGLTEPEIAELREQLAAGRRPRVQLSGPQFPVEATGTVVRIGSPEIDGPDYLRVRVKVNGMTDELAFEPNELRRRSARARKATAKAAGRPARTRPAKAATQPAKTTASPVQPAKTAAQPRKASTRAGAAEHPAKPAAEPVKAATQPDAAPQGKPSPARRRKPGSTPTVSFTVSSSGANWTVGASRGNRSLARNVALPPGVVTALAELIGQPVLTEAVSEINDAALAEARTRAEQLRAELDQLEAVLATHRRP
jgi:hypothetical protein